MKCFNILFVFLFTITIGCGQVILYNQYPSLTPSHILDEKLTDISFALSMRVLESDFNGALIRLRRESDNAERDFGWGDNDIVDVAAIDNWRAGSNVYIHTWYDQSGLGRDAIQTTMTLQPQFYPDVSLPYFQGDGTDDHLTIDTPQGIQDVTNSGAEGSVLTIIKTTNKTQHSFGVLTGTDRWSIHGNWSGNTFYFDPGICCNNPRSFANSDGANIWQHYVLIRKNGQVIMRRNGLEKVNGTYSNGPCTRTEDFAIGWATGDQSIYHSTTGFIELIMYKIDIPEMEYEDIEENAIIFWNL